jgi:outer membrane biosynthesis protein TonB
MEFLSLQEPVEVPSVRMSRSEAILVSIGLHLLLVLLFVLGPVAASRVLPESVRAFLGARPRFEHADPAAAVATATGTKPSAPRIPLKFAYVNVPNDTASDKNPNARLLSDKNRRARQEVPTPPETKKFSLDPHSKGTSIERVKPDPSRPEGREDAEAQHRAARGTPSPGGGGTEGSGTLARNREAQAASTPRADGLLRPEGPTGDSPGERATQEGRGSPGDRGVPEGTGEPGADSRESLKQALSDLKAGEYKFQFNNPAYLRGGGYGTMSFDTQDFPWGDYARRIYLVIRNNWYARIPLAAREGIRGWDCQRFVIEKDGTISSVRTVRPSGVAPFDKSSADALSASSRLPPLPEDFPESSEGVTFCFYYNMYPGEESE